MLKYASNWGGLDTADNGLHEELYNKYVPACGKANTLGGEILRAINRIVYKFYNDGDTVAHYYSSSYNHSYGAEMFLEQHVPGYKPMREIHGDEEFEEAAHENLVNVMKYLKEHPEVFETPNGEDFLDLSPKEEWEEEDYDEWGDEENEEETDEEYE